MFSFHPRKVQTTGEGGVVTCNDPDFAARMLRMRVHGIDVDADVRRRSGVVTEQHAEPGFNMGMTDIQAAIDRVQFARPTETIARRRAHAARYAQNLGAIASIGLPQEPDWARSNWQSYCVGLPEGCDQYAVMRSLVAEGLASRRGILCAHREPAYPVGSWFCRAGPRTCDCAAGAGRRLAESERAQDRAIQIRLLGAMLDAELGFVAATLAHACLAQA